MFVEIIYETGNMSVAYYETEEEALSALAEHHRRATSGERGNPEGSFREGGGDVRAIPAERIKSARVYSQHPDNWGMSAEVATMEINELIAQSSDENGVIDIAALAQKVRDLGHPMVDGAGAHESKFKMPEERELELPFLTEGVQ